MSQDRSAPSRIVPLLAALAAACSSSASSGPDAGTSRLSSAKSITSLSFLKADNRIPVDSTATISGLSIHAFLPSGTSVTALKASFAASSRAAVSVKGSPQASGSSVNDYSVPVSYLVTAEDGSTQSYTVTVTTELAAFDDAVKAFMSNHAVPAASIAVTRGEKLIYLKAYGQQDREASQPTTVQSLFRLASVSKPLTSVTILKLVEQGKLGLDDTVFGPGGILGTTYGSQPYGPHLTEITVNHLLHHTGGGWANDKRDPMFLNPAMTAAQLISWTLDNQPLKTVPGAAYAYSNFGYCVLGRVIEKLTGLPYEAAVRGLVLAPLGITDMTIAGNTLADRLPNEVKYYGQGGEDPYAFNIRRMDSHGGWLATARDLASFLVHVDGFSAKADLLSAPSLATMTTPSSANANYACGWSVNAANNWWHIGSLPGTGTEIIRAAIGWNWVLLVNSRSPGASFTADLDQLFWTAHAQPGGVPDYDLFQ
jgi:D-alanyl-D-alanine carboxypeptidase